MHSRNLTLGLALSAMVLLGGCSPDNVSAQNPRFGTWINQGNPDNVMIYEPYGNGGMKITVGGWNYTTMFDGVFVTVDGLQDSETAVEIIDEFSTRIINKRNGRVSQVIINTLSAAGSTINNEYIRMDADGKIVGVGHVIYERSASR
tara:strand:- start:28 stop:468 length:441 start_codon:yes stop_codon:yes gene_type:complete